MDKIIHGNVLVGIRLKSILKHGTNPITNEKEFLQLLALKFNKGEKIKPHLHSPLKRITSRLQECLVVKKGEIKIDLFTLKKKYLRSIRLKEGEAFILLAGGCSIYFLKNSEIFEIKNGPFKKDVIYL